MQPIFRQQPISDEEHNAQDQRVMPSFLFYFYGLAFLTSLFSSVSLAGPLLLGFALLPRQNSGLNTGWSPVAVLVATFIVRLVAGVLGLVKTGLLLVDNWQTLHQHVADSGYYLEASPWMINSLLAAGVIMAGIFVYDNAEAMIRSFVKEWAAETK